MITINSSSIETVWRDVTKLLLRDGKVTNTAYRDASAVIVIDDISRPFFDESFPMSERDIEVINNYLVTGQNEELVVHDWTKIYRKRLFGEDGGQNQIASIIKYLKKQPQGKRAQTSIWKAADINADIAPCLQVLWFQIKDDHLEMHVHMRACDAYGKLLMNVNEFAALQRYVASELGIESGRYIHFIDTLHFNVDDEEKIKSLFS